MNTNPSIKPDCKSQDVRNYKKRKQASDEMRQKLHIMEIQRDRAIEIALDCLNGRMGKEEIIALADLIEATNPNK